MSALPLNQQSGDRRHQLRPQARVQVSPLQRVLVGQRRFFRGWVADLRGCWGSARRLFLRQLAQQYRHSWLGLFWAVVPSVLTALVLIGGRQGQILGSGVVISAAFYGVFGLAMAQTFLEGINGTRLLFATNQKLFRRYNVPLDGFVIAALLDILFNMIVRLAVISPIFLLFAVRPVVGTLPLAAVGFLAIALLGAGLGLLFAPFNSLKRDINNIFNFLPWVLFAITPVFVPLPLNSSFGIIASSNPLSHLFNATRAAAYGGLGEPLAVMPALFMGLVIMFFGWIFCRIARPYVIERTLG